MTFAEELENNIYEPWRFEYVAYNQILSQMQEKQRQSGWTAQDEEQFKKTLQLEVDKVDSFITRKQHEIDARILHCERSLMHHRGRTDVDNPVFEKIDNDLKEIIFDLNDLSKFARFNYLAFEKLIKKHDESTNKSAQPLMVAIMRQRPFDRQRFDVALVKLSELHDLCRQHGQQRQSMSTTENALHGEQHTTAKYWVHPDNLTELKAMILFHLPIQVPENQSSEATTGGEEVTTVYFDNRSFDIYSQWLQRDEDAESIRLRWKNEETSSPLITLERKTRNSVDQDNETTKDRVQLDKEKIISLLSGNYTTQMYTKDLLAQGMGEDDIKEADLLLDRIQKLIKSHSLQPLVSVSYNRTLFQDPDDMKLRISLETNIAFVKKVNLEDSRSLAWTEEDFNRPNVGKLPADTVYKFPYAILEVKMQNDSSENLPQWMTHLLNSNLAFEVPRFSKQLQGTCHFYNSHLALLPWWLDVMNLDIRHTKQEQGHTGLSRSESLRPLIDGNYPVGYLERQLSKRATLKRKKSPETEGSTPFHSIHPVRSREPLTNGVISPLPSRPGDAVHPSVMVDMGLPSEPESTGPKNRLLNLVHSVSDNLIHRDEEKGDENPNLSKEGKKAIKKEKKRQEKEAKKLLERKERIEPKVFFANERTFIHWLQFSALILSSALTLLNFGDHISTISGATFLGISIILAIYAFGRFRYRTHQIHTRPHMRFDDLYGPIMLCFLLIGAMLLNSILRFMHPSSSDTYLGINNQTQQQTTSQVTSIASQPTVQPEPQPQQLVY